MKKTKSNSFLQSREEQVLSLAVVGLVAVLVALLVVTTSNNVITQIEFQTSSVASVSSQ